MLTDLVRPLPIRLLAALVLGGAAQGAAALDIAVTGPEESAYKWAEDRCDEDQIPDSPVRAFRSVDGNVRLMAAHFNNQFLVGPQARSVKRNCTSAFAARMENAPEKFNARTWLQTFYTEDGQTIYSLGSADYHGSWFDRCSGRNNDNPKCWRSAIVLAVSKDGGTSFTTAEPPQHIIARPPNSFESEERGRPAGFFTTSNIVKRGNFYYTLINTQGFDEQKPGNCLIRTDKLENPDSWRAWNGKDFAIRLPRAAGDKEPPCTIVNGPTEPFRTVLQHVPSGLYVAVSSSTKREPAGKKEGMVVRFRFMTSKDLVNWSPPRDFVELRSTVGCAKGVPPVTYPALFDPDSADRNFGTIGDTGYVYYTRFNGANSCRLTMDRDLVRMPIKLTP